MPSWNIHTAHVEKLLAEEDPETLGILDANSFLFGNLAPDIYVGYIVPDVSHKLEYRKTHLADLGFIPTPDAAGFYESYVSGPASGDLELGAWTHLICDHYYNLRTIEYIDSIGVKPGEQTRIRKQADFDVFGRTLTISGVPKATPDLVAHCASFAQYPILEPDVYATIRAQMGIVRRNEREHVDGTPAYSLLTDDFFTRTFAEVDSVLRQALHTRVRGGEPTAFGRASA